MEGFEQKSDTMYLNFKWVSFAAVLRVDCRGWAKVYQGEREGNKEKHTCGLDKGDSGGQRLSG